MVCKGSKENLNLLHWAQWRVYTVPAQYTATQNMTAQFWCTSAGHTFCQIMLVFPQAYLWSYVHHFLPEGKVYKTVCKPIHSKALCHILLCRATFSSTYLCYNHTYLHSSPHPPPPPKPFPLLPSRTTFNLPAYHVLLSSLSVGLLSCLNHLNSVLDKAPKFGLVMIGRQAWVPDLMLWVYICYICIMFMFTLSYGD